MTDWTRTPTGSYALHLPDVDVYLCPSVDPRLWIVSCCQVGIEREAITADGAEAACKAALGMARKRARMIAGELEACRG